MLLLVMMSKQAYLTQRLAACVIADMMGFKLQPATATARKLSRQDATASLFAFCIVIWLERSTTWAREKQVS